VEINRKMKTFNDNTVLAVLEAHEISMKAAVDVIRQEEPLLRGDLRGAVLSVLDIWESFYGKPHPRRKEYGFERS
jgi:hypothetical protein